MKRLAFTVRIRPRLGHLQSDEAVSASLRRYSSRNGEGGRSGSSAAHLHLSFSFALLAFPRFRLLLLHLRPSLLLPLGLLSERESDRAFVTLTRAKEVNYVARRTECVEEASRSGVGT